MRLQNNLWQRCRVSCLLGIGCTALGPSKVRGDVVTVWLLQKQTPGYLRRRLTGERSWNSACWGHGMHLGCDAVTTETSGPHAHSGAGVVLQGCID